MSDDYYLILGIPVTADTDEIRTAYRSLAKEHHPDSGGSDDRFREILKAYEVLSDPGERVRYDLSQQTAPQESGRMEKGQSAERVEVFYKRSFRGRPRSWNFTTSSGGGGASSTSAKQRYLLVLAPHEVGKIRNVPIPISTQFPCKTCRGTGFVRPFPCRSCGASGVQEDSIAVQVPLPSKLEDGKILEFVIRQPGIQDQNFQLRISIRSQ